MFNSCPSATVSMERDIVNWALERGLSKESYCSNWMSKPVLWLLRALRFGWETMNRYPKTIPGLLAVGSSTNRTNEPTSKVQEVTNVLSERPHRKLWDWLGAKGYWHRGSKYYIYLVPLHQSPHYPPKLGCLIGYARTSLFYIIRYCFLYT